MTAAGVTELAPGQDFTAWQARYRRDLALAIREWWNVTPDKWQTEVADALSKEGVRRIAVASGHGVGKTAIDAWAAIWFLLTRMPCKVPITAPSKSTLEDGLFAEIKLWLGRLPPAVRDLVEITSDRVVLKAAPNRAFISVRTARADKPDALQGIHADYVLLIADEPSGIPAAVFEAAQGSLAGPARYMLMTGNPVYASGYFYDSITTNRDTIWRVWNVSCLDVARVPPEYIQEMAALYGEDSNVFRVRVLGLPPKGDDDTIIPLHLVQAAYDRDVAPVSTAPLIWGLDVARLGANQAALAKRRGNALIEAPERFGNRDLMQLCGTVAAQYHGLNQAAQPAQICVDSIGLGAGVVDRGRELDLPMVGINVSEHAAVNQMHWNLKSELWWRARAWLEARDCKMPKDAELTKALTCVRVDHHSTGKLLVESKERLARRLKARLPRMDAADAFILTFAETATAALYGRQLFGRRRQRGALKRKLKGIV